ncbi:MAG: YihY family inner membrane protein [Rhodanobacter sp.]
MTLRFDRDRTRTFSHFLWQRFMDDKCFETAGALSYTTLVSLVPLMVAGLAMFSVFPVFAGARDTLLDFVFRNFVPAAGEHVKEALQDFAKNASGLTGISILVMLFSAISMMVSIEDRLNRIWRVQRHRSWTSRLLLYWAALTLGPILVVGGLAASSYITALPLLQDTVAQSAPLAQPPGQLAPTNQLASAASQAQPDQPAQVEQLTPPEQLAKTDQPEHHEQSGKGVSALRVVPFAVTFITLWLMYAVIPNRRVSRRDAAIGAIIGAVLFEIARSGFRLFVHSGHTYQQIYGKALAAIPIFLVWIYLSWVIVILCASIAASISAYEYQPPTKTLPKGAEFLGLLVLLRYFVEAQREGRCVDPDVVRSREPYLSNVTIAAYLDDLKHAELIQRNEAGGWLLTRSLDSTDLLHVYKHSGYRLPLDPVQSTVALGITLPSELMVLLTNMSETLSASLGTPLDRAYPASSPVVAKESVS